jgi:hypothetical protein
MKCVRLNDGSVSRVPNDLAARLVYRGMADYVPKAAWKRLKREHEAVEEPSLGN